jgi:hypothetical protein
MMISLNGLGWQNAVQPQSRISNEQALAEVMPVRQTVATNTTRQQNNQANTSQQNAEDAREEAFAKLKVALQNPDISARQQASIGTQDGSNALQEFRDYMNKTPEEKIQEKILAELGLTPEEFEALPPEQKQKIGEQIAQRLKEDIELQTQAKLQEQALSAAAVNPAADPASAHNAEQRKDQLQVMAS